MNLRYCDKCEKLIGSESDADILEGTAFPDGMYEVVARPPYKNTEHETMHLGYRTIDLCPACMKELHEHVRKYLGDKPVRPIPIIEPADVRDL